MKIGASIFKASLTEWEKDLNLHYDTVIVNQKNTAFFWSTRHPPGKSILIAVKLNKTRAGLRGKPYICKAISALPLRRGCC